MTGGKGFTVVDAIIDIANHDADNSTISVYDASGAEISTIPSGEFSGVCGAADVLVPGRGRLILTELLTKTAAEGINPGRSKLTLDAWDAKTAARVWTATVAAKDASNCPPGDKDEDLDSFAPTVDGRWGYYGGSINGGSSNPEGMALDLRNGTVQPNHRSNGVLGRFLGHADGIKMKVNALDPVSGDVLGRLTGVDFDNRLIVAPPGVFNVNSSGSSAPSGTSLDGKTFFSLTDDDVDDQAITSYDLPSARRLWQKRKLASPFILGEGGGILVISKGDEYSPPAVVAGLDARTGAQRWTIPAGTLCAITSSQLLLAINGQLATIDLQTGKQLSYTRPDPDSETNGDSDQVNCPDALRGGIEVESGDDVTVTQLLEP